jgi:hypothetical protein
MGDMKPSTAAAGRQVLDRTYFINELRQKRQQTMAVIIQMQVRFMHTCQYSCMLMAGRKRISGSPMCGHHTRSQLAAVIANIK